MANRKITKRLTLILGGARSGKSSFAEILASKRGTRVLYVATATPGDQEMERRIETHRVSRPATWRTLEEPLEVPRAIATVSDVEVVLLDCLTLWVSNILLVDRGEQCPDAEAEVLRRVEELVQVYERGAAGHIVIANEVGLGIVPEYPLGRVYRDALGRANQMLASAADEVYFMVAGLPMAIKKRALGRTRASAPSRRG